jgi:sugar phosphate isomerase/epimerase
MTEKNRLEIGRDGGNDQKWSVANRRGVLAGIGTVSLGGSITGQVQASDPAESGDRSQKALDEIPISTQLWTYNTNSDKSVAELIRASAAAGYDAVEPFYLDNPRSISTALEETDVSLSSAHVSVDQLEDDFVELAQTYSDFGASTLIHGYQSPNTFTDEDSIVAFADRINAMSDRLADWGINYGYHNYNHEFEVLIGDTTAYDIFAQHVNDDVHLQLDVGWALVGGVDPVSILNEYSDKIGSVHMKDMTAKGTFEEIGDGDVDMQALAGIIRETADVDYLVYEYDGAPHPMESLQTGAEFLKTWSGSHK